MMKVWILLVVMLCLCGCTNSQSNCTKFGSEPYLQYKVATLQEYNQCSAYFVKLTEKGNEEQKFAGVYTIGRYRDNSKVGVLEAAVRSNRNSVVGISGIDALRSMGEKVSFEKLLFSKIDLATVGACRGLKDENPILAKAYIEDLLDRFERGKIEATDPKFIKRLKRYLQQIQKIISLD